jgi:hypothetical protein
MFFGNSIGGDFSTDTLSPSTKISHQIKSELPKNGWLLRVPSLTAINNHFRQGQDTPPTVKAV